MFSRSCLLMLLVGCGARGPGDVATPDLQPPAFQASEGRFVLLHTNDMHSYHQPSPARWLEGAPSIGGAKALDSYVRTVRGGEEPVLLLDAGDILSGTPLSDLEVDGLQGGAMLRIMEHVGYDAWTIGNHEFDKGWEHLSALVAASEIPVVSANMAPPDGVEGPTLPNLEPSVVLEAGPLKVGVIGVITEDLSRLVGADNIAQVTLLPAVDAVRAEMEKLEPITDLQVVLSHAGVDMDRIIAREVAGVDLVVGGHTHTPIKEPEQVGDAWVVQAGSYMRSIGRLDLHVRDQAIVSISGGLVDLAIQDDWEPPGEALVEDVDRWQATIDEKYGQEVGEAAVALVRHGEGGSPVGHWITGALRAAAETDIAVYNSGGLRADIPEGTLTLRDVYEVFPFGNMLAVLHVKGSAILKILEQNSRVLAGSRGAYLPVSGVEWEWSKGDDGKVVVSSATVGGEPLDPEAVYSVATNDYLAGHWQDKHGGLVSGPEEREESVLDLALAALAEGPADMPPAPSRKAP